MININVKPFCGDNVLHEHLIFEKYRIDFN